MEKIKDFDFDITSLPAINVIYDVLANRYQYDRKQIQQIEVQPRKVKRLGARDHLRTPWIFNQSVFKHYRQDNTKILDKCFEFDWSFIFSKVEYLIKS